MFPKWSLTFRVSQQKSTCIYVLSMRATCPVHRNIFNWITHIRCVKGRAISKQARTGFQEVEDPRFEDSRLMIVVRLSTLPTDRLYPPGDIPGTHFCSTLSRSQGNSAAGRIMSMKNSNDTIGNRTRDLPACSAVPQPTAPRSAPNKVWRYNVVSTLQVATFIDV
jgi:hypothetical protein